MNLNGDKARSRARELGITIGSLNPGPGNTLTDVASVTVGHTTLIQGDNIRTGVTAIMPHEGNLFQQKTPAAIAVGNGFGKLAGSTQVQTLGTLESPIILTNTLSVAAGIQGAVRYTLAQPGNEKVRSINALVGETNDSYLNDIQGMHVTPEDVLDAIHNAKPGNVDEGCVGAGTGTSCFNYKGGIGTASRKLPDEQGGYTVGVLLQSNFGGELLINGAPVGKELSCITKPQDQIDTPGDGSCMIVIATDAPLCNKNLQRLAERAMLGLARTGSHLAHGSGDYAIAFTTAYQIPHTVKHRLRPAVELLHHNSADPLFQATVEATQEAVYNSLFMSTTTAGDRGHIRQGIPLDRVVSICQKYNVIS